MASQVLRTAYPLRRRGPIGQLSRDQRLCLGGLLGLCALTIAGVPPLLHHIALGLTAVLGLIPGWTALLLASAQIIGGPQYFASDSAGRWLTLILLSAASFRTVGRVPTFLVVWLAYIVLASATFSVWPDLSTSKSLSLVLALVTIARLSDGMALSRKSEVLDLWFGVMCIASLVAILVGAGTGRGGYTGVTSHPQLLGLISALAFVWSANGLVQSASPSRLGRATALTSFVLLLLSASRTAVIASLSGVLAGVLVAWLGTGVAARTQRSRIAANAGLVLSALLVVLLVAGAERIESFLQKGKDVELTPVALIVEARGGQMEASLANWERQPLVGIGLGIPSYFDVPGARDAIQYLGPVPVALSVEKGFGLTAVLEELGIIGSVLTWAGLGVLMIQGLRSAGLQFGGLIVTAILSNAGDFVLLSAGGSGLLVWTCILSPQGPRVVAAIRARSLDRPQALSVES